MRCYRHRAARAEGNDEARIKSFHQCAPAFVIACLVEKPVVDAERELLSWAIILHEPVTDIVFRSRSDLLDNSARPYAINVKAQFNGLYL